MDHFEKPEDVSEKGEEHEKPETELEKFIFEKLNELNFSNGLSKEAKHIIGEMKKHSEYTYNHMLRVARVSYLESRKFGGSGKLEFIGGLLHDLGKLSIDPKLLFPDKNISEEDYKIVQKHALKGWKDLENDYTLTALVVGAHHNHGEKGYGVEEEDWPDFVKNNPDLRRSVEEAVLMVAMADFADAARTRITPERSGGEAPPRDKMLAKFPGQEKKIDYILEDEEIVSLYKSLSG